MENMSYILCPDCGANIELFGSSHAESTARSIGTRLLGHVPLDPQLSRLCDEGAIEVYHSEIFEGITDLVVEQSPIREPELP
jgi:hypothetical protein